MSSNGKAKAVASPGQSPHQNHLLDALPAGDCDRVASHLELIPLRLGAAFVKDDFGPWVGAACPAAPHPGADDPDGADGGLQPGSLDQSAAVALVVVIGGPSQRALPVVKTEFDRLLPYVAR